MRVNTVLNLKEQFKCSFYVVNFANILQKSFCQFPIGKKMQSETKSTEKLCVILCL